MISMRTYSGRSGLPLSSVHDALLALDLGFARVALIRLGLPRRSDRRVMLLEQVG